MSNKRFKSGDKAFPIFVPIDSFEMVVDRKSGPQIMGKEPLTVKCSVGGADNENLRFENQPGIYHACFFHTQVEHEKTLNKVN
jgi:hypothetical protein